VGPVVAVADGEGVVGRAGGAAVPGDGQIIVAVVAEVRGLVLAVGERDEVAQGVVGHGGGVPVGIGDRVSQALLGVVVGGDAPCGVLFCDQAADGIVAAQGGIVAGVDRPDDQGLGILEAGGVCPSRRSGSSSCHQASRRSRAGRCRLGG